MMEQPTGIVFGVHPLVAHMRSMTANLEARTGRGLAAWIEVVRREGPAGDRERLVWLKTRHKLGGATAGLIVECVAGRGRAFADEETYLAAAPRLVDALFSGPKAALRPLYEALARLACSIADDVRICPTTTAVSIHRRHVVAEIKPASRTRIELDLALGAEKGGGRLVETGGLAKKDRLTHRVVVERLEEIDDELTAWLRLACERDAEP
ncbi:DUF5655 domain-containing protein [bacterium]|nr:DUF5655 domain-containing protein [bacterium]